MTTGENGCLKTVSPTWRGDIECEADLVEEVVRMAGLDNIPALSMPADEFPKQTLNPAQRRAVTVKHELAARGMFETVTWSFTDSKLAGFFRKSGEAVKLTNPIAAELDEMRPSPAKTLPAVPAASACLRSDRNFSVADPANKSWRRSASAAA